MAQFSNSPLGLIMYSDDDSSVNRVGSYNPSSIVSGASYSSLFKRETGRSRNTSGAYSYEVSGEHASGSENISTTEIIEYCSMIPAMELKYADFAYLKNIGVYPNNRLFIARRFQSPVTDDLLTVGLSDSKRDVQTYSPSPIATLISWVPDNTNFISVEYGEEWQSAEASFKNVLNDIGRDVLMGDNKGGMLGNTLAGAMNVIPLAGFTEGLQYEVMKSLGITDIDASKLPLGNPNLIREAKRRKTLDKEEAGSGLSCKFKIDMSVEYEQKFINGIDPTIVYYDIIANALSFGTSEAQFQFSGKMAGRLNDFLSDIGSGDASILKGAMIKFIAAIGSAIQKVGNQLINIFRDSKSKDSPTTQKDPKEVQAESDRQTNAATNKAFDFLRTVGLKTIQGLVSKYKIRIMGVANALTGSPSAPWHVTIGNPKRPIFSSGDMVVTSVKMTMGKLLAYNDLPSSIKLDFTLESSRNLGAQEIFSKFNSGRQRTYVRSNTYLSFVDTDTEITQDDVNAASNEMSNYRGANPPTVNKDTSSDSVEKTARDADYPRGLSDYYSGYDTMPNSNEADKVDVLTTITIPDPSGTTYNIKGNQVLDKNKKKVGTWTAVNGDGSVQINFDNGTNLVSSPKK